MKDALALGGDGESTMQTEINSGDVIEFIYEGEATSALVLLVAADSAILDPCDGSTPFVLPLDELESVRVYQPLGIAA